MKNLKINKPLHINIENNNIDTQLNDNEALIAIKRVSICGSDYKLFAGKYNAPNIYPITPGHEWSGVVMEIGDNSKDINKGDHVTGDCSIWCGHCEYCKINKNLCQNIKKYGISTDGFMKEIARVPVKYLYKAPKSVPFSVLALTEPFAVALNAIKRLGLEKRDKKNCLIIGGGAIGMSIYLLLELLYKIDNVMIFETNQVKCKIIKEIFPEVKFYNYENNKSKTSNDYKSIYEAGSFNCVFESAGNLPALELALDCIKPLGKILTLGFYASGEINLNKITIKSTELIGSIGGTGSFEEVLTFFEEYYEIAEKIISKVYTLDSSPQLFQNELNFKNSLKLQVEIQK